MAEYKKNAFRIFHQLFLRVEELCMEINIRQMQMASIFAALQQVETRYRKEADTVEEHNCHRALARLTRARYIKNMKSFTKQLKKNAPLTHNYELPSTNNENKLTKKLPPKDNQILIPNIENNIDEELNKLGISNLLTPRDNKEADWLYAELLQIMCSEEKMSNKIYFTYIYFIVVPCDAVLVETWGCCPSFQLSQKVNPTL